MSILSTNTKLIKAGQDYSAGSGISIDDKVISVTGEFGKTYSAGENISIYNKDEQLYISSKDWTNDIANASANAYNKAVAQIPSPFDPSFISGQVDNKLDTTAFTNWQNGQYTTDLQTIEGQISNKLDESAFSQVSASFLTAINIPESATWNEVSQAYEQASATYLTSISIPESAVWQDVSTTVQSNSAQWAEGGSGDEEVNSFVYNNSATIDEAITSYQTNSGNYLIKTASMPTIGRNLTGNGVFGLAVGARSKSFDYGLSIGEWTNKNVKNARSNAAIGYSAHAYGTGSQAFGEQVVVSAGMAIGKCNKTSACSFVIGNGTSNTARNDIFVINYDGSVSAAGKISANGVELGTGGGNQEIEIYVQNNSATINEVNTAYQSNSSNYITAHQSLDGYATTSWVNEQGYLTEVSIPMSSIWTDVTTAVQINSAHWNEDASGAISSYATDFCNYVPPYGDYVIKSLNGKFISAFISNSADRANFAKSANYAETVNETYLENKGFTRNLSSEYGTISVINNNIIESTNSAIVRTVNEGFVSSFSSYTVGPEGTATYSWDKSFPSTTIDINVVGGNGEILKYSANTDLTGEIVAPVGGSILTINIPNATEFNLWANKWVYVHSATVSAAGTFETVVGELAWASALPTYEYDTTNKISAINGSAIGGAEIVNHDNTLSGNGTVESPLCVVPGYNETVLWSGSWKPGNGKVVTNSAIEVSESVSNFEYIRVVTEGILCQTITMTPKDCQALICYPESDDRNSILGLKICKDDDTHIRFRCGYSTNFIQAYRSGADWGYFTLKKIIGINRKA